MAVGLEIEGCWVPRESAATSRQEIAETFVLLAVLLHHCLPDGLDMFDLAQDRHATLEHLRISHHIRCCAAPYHCSSYLKV